MLTIHADSFSMQPSHVADACCMENLMFYSDVMMLDASHAACFGLIQTRRFGQVHPFALESFLGSAPTSQWHQQRVSNRYSPDSFQFAILICANSIHLLCLSGNLGPLTKVDDLWKRSARYGFESMQELCRGW